MISSKFRQNDIFAQRSILNFSRFLGGGWWGGAKLSGLVPKVSPKFWQNFMSKKFQKNHNTSNGPKVSLKNILFFSILHLGQ